MEWVKNARTFYGRTDVRAWVEQRCQSGDVRLWLPSIDDILDSSNETSRWYYAGMRRQYDADLRDFDPGVTMITFTLYPGCYQPSGYINMSRLSDVYYANVIASNDVVY